MANIRIQLQCHLRGSKSYIGTDAILVKSGPTMWLGVLGLPDTHYLVQNHVLHEFGHAIGLVHEVRAMSSSHIHLGHKQSCG